MTPSHAGIRQGRIDMGLQLGKSRQGHHVHGFAGNIPGDGGDTIGIDSVGEFGHLVSSRIVVRRLAGRWARARASAVTGSSITASR